MAKKIRIKLKAFDHRVLDASATQMRLIDIIDPTQKTMEALMELNLPSGVDIQIKL